MEQGDPFETPPHELLSDDLFPPDSYAGTVYWADLPLDKRIKWVNHKSYAEAHHELTLLCSTFKRHPLQPIREHFSKYVITGMGLFVEGYVLFSVGNLTSLFEAVWPLCWGSYEVCSENWIASVLYLEIVGIIIGQITVGILGDWIGRRWGLIQDALVMFTGTILLTAMWGKTLQGWIIMYAISLMWLSFGVGGEYPMTSTRAMEGHPRDHGSSDRLHRGRKVLLAFAMQGWGQFANQGVLIICLLMFHGGGSPPYGELSTQWTFRVSFAFVGIFIIYLVYYRVYRLAFADHHLKLSKRKHGVTGYDVRSLRLIVTQYWHRFLGTAGCWFCSNFFFYGTKIFQGVFIKVIDPESTVLSGWLWNLLNVGCALVGYYMAAVLIDYKLYGRMRMQAVGFFAIFVIFVISAALFNKLEKPGSPVKVFQFMYFFSSFWSQFGPNGTTFLLAAEVYPASVRATAHGFASACGKLGALIPAIIYNYVGNRTKFWIVSWFGLVGFILTIVFVADTTGLDLSEQEKYWSCIRRGRVQDYHGVAIHPRHLSLWESRVLHHNRYYDPALDKQNKINELRAKYQASIARTNIKDELELHDNWVSENVARHFQMEKEKGHPERSKETTKEEIGRDQLRE